MNKISPPQKKTLISHVYLQICRFPAKEIIICAVPLNSSLSHVLTMVISGTTYNDYR